ncbi:MAG TPA: hypothetical protein PKH10_01545 [bacterium]|nr:hypothetical protein [bacterium]
MNDLTKMAKNINYDSRRSFLLSMKETKLHEYIKELFVSMEPSYYVEITHGSNEMGKDLVLIRSDKLSTEAIAVVVKKGTISGKTAGDIDEIRNDVQKIFSSGERKIYDEIISQIRQSMCNKAELKTLIDKVIISRVFVFLFGELSNQAKDRLDGELKAYEGAVEYYPMKRIIDLFTDFYPQIFFKGKLHDYIMDKIKCLEDSVVIKTGKSKLSEIFVPPLITKTGFPVFNSLEDAADYTKKQVLKTGKEKISLQNIDKLFSNNRKVILIGEPGSGKSCALNKIALDAFISAQKDIVDGKSGSVSLPIKLHSKRLVNDNIIDNIVEDYIGKEALGDNKITIKYILVDSLDEVDQEDREKVIENASKISDKYNAPLVITSRKLGMLDQPPADFEKYEILPFSYVQVLKFMKNMFFDDLAKMNIIKKQINQLNMPYYPLALTLLVELVSEYNEIPASITELYSRYFDLALGKEDRDKGISILFEYTIKRQFLAKLAYCEMMLKNQTSITKEEFVVFCENYKSDIPSNHSKDMVAFVNEIERTGIIKCKDKVFFGHRSFMEYFSAYHVFENQTEYEDINQHLVDLYFNDKNEDIVFFFCGMKRKLSQKLVKKIFEEKPKDMDEIQSMLIKYMTPRLLQSAFSTNEQTKIETIINAANISGKIRNGIMSTFMPIKNKISPIFADIIMMNYSMYSLSSMFIKNEIIEAIKVISKNTEPEVPYMMMYLLGGIEEKISIEEKDEIIKKIIDTMINNKISKKDEAQILLFLIKMEENNKSIKSATRKLEKIKRRNKELFNTLFIPQKIKKLL